MIQLRELELADISQLNAWRNDKSLVDSLGNNFRYIAEHIDENWYKDYIKNREKQVRLAILTDESKRYVGNVNLTNIHPINASAEFSILIGDESARGKGVGLLATKMILTHGFKNLNLHRIYLTVLVDNQPALTLYEKVGFKRDGIEREAVFKNGKFQDLVCMSMLKHEFQE